MLQAIRNMLTSSAPAATAPTRDDLVAKHAALTAEMETACVTLRSDVDAAAAAMADAERVLDQARVRFRDANAALGVAMRSSDGQIARCEHALRAMAPPIVRAFTDRVELERLNLLERGPRKRPLEPWIDGNGKRHQQFEEARKGFEVVADKMLRIMTTEAVELSYRTTDQDLPAALEQLYASIPFDELAKFDTVIIAQDQAPTRTRSRSMAVMMADPAPGEV